MNGVFEPLSPDALKREIGHAGGWSEGPTVMFVAGLHGNEPAGVVALQRVFRTLEERRVPIAGQVVGLAGNLEGLRQRRRFVDEDMNRVWSTERMAALDAGTLEDSSEAREQVELVAAIRKALRFARGPVFVLDLHTASADTPPFLVLGDTLRNREFARGFPLPIVLGLEEHIPGTLMEWMTELGHLGIAVEAGSHEDPRSVERHEAAIWAGLALAGSFDGKDPFGIVADSREQLERMSADIPRILEIFYRHALAEDDHFRMRPGFVNFDPVPKRAKLADFRHEELKSHAAGRIFLPLYQEQGEDGFFLARPVNAIWLAVSAFLRRIGAPALAPYLPGVSVHPERKNTLVVNTRIARFFTRRIFHLLGYRLDGVEGTKLTVQRRDPAG